MRYPGQIRVSRHRAIMSCSTSADDRKKSITGHVTGALVNQSNMSYHLTNLSYYLKSESGNVDMVVDPITKRLVVVTENNEMAMTRYEKEINEKGFKSG